MSPQFLQLRLAPPAVATLVFLLASPPAHAGLLLNGCGTVTILEGMTGLMNCTVMNTGADPVEIDGSFVFAVPQGPDFSDQVIGIRGVGDQLPTIAAMDSNTFQYELLTPPADKGEKVDFGISIVNALYSGIDTVTHAFVPGQYTGGVANVLDANDVMPTPPKVPPSKKTVDSRADFTTQVVGGIIISRIFGSGSFTPVPEPGTLTLLGIGLIGLGLARRRKA